jgi:DNA uptake protein ComE-like DNA-binding protein
MNNWEAISMKDKKKYGGKYSLVLLSLLFFFLFAYTPAFAFILGDVNNDGLIDVRDLVLVSRYSKGLEDFNSAQKEAADVNLDSVVDDQDVSLIMKKLLGFVDDFSAIVETPEPISEPVPIPEPDPQPTPETDPTHTARVNINTADFEELKIIIHIDNVRAQEIIEKRPFNSLDDLSRINGIGPTRLQEIKDEGIAYVE